MSALGKVSSKFLEAKLHESNFDMADSNFYSLTLGSDNCLYFTLCSHNIDTHGRVYRYNPDLDEMKLIADLGEITGEAGNKTLPQGKSHTPFFENNGKLYFATHYGYFKADNDKEEPAELPAGYKPYPGGHFVEIDMLSGTSKVLATVPGEEGILTMNYDIARGRLYGLTWPGGYFLYYDMNKNKLVNLGPVSRDGEVGIGDRYFCLTRTFCILPDNGNVYFTNPDGEILYYEYASNEIKIVQWAHMRKDVFGYWDPHKPGHQGYNWRPCKWHPGHEVFYGVHPRSGYLFRFDPRNEKHEIIDRICSEAILTGGRYEQFRYGYLTLDFAPHDPETIYYISGYHELKETPKTREDEIFSQTKGSSYFGPVSHGKTINYLTFVSYHLPTRTYEDHGIIKLDDGRFPSNTQSIAAHPNGRIYTVPWIGKPGWKKGEGKWQQCDLISFEP